MILTMLIDLLSFSIPYISFIILKVCLTLELVIDSFGIFGTITSLRKVQYYPIRPTVSIIRDAFENGEITKLVSTPGSIKRADTLASIITIPVLFVIRFLTLEISHL